MHKSYVDERFSHNVLSVLDAFSMFNLDSIPTYKVSGELRGYGHSEIKVLSNHFVDQKETADNYFKEWENFKF